MCSNDYNSYLMDIFPCSCLLFCVNKEQLWCCLLPVANTFSSILTKIFHLLSHSFQICWLRHLLPYLQHCKRINPFLSYFRVLLDLFWTCVCDICRFELKLCGNFKFIPTACVREVLFCSCKFWNLK